MLGLDVEDQMVQSNRERGERNLTARIRIRQLGCEEEILKKVEILGDLIIDYATEQNRVIKEGLLKLKEITNQ